MRVSIPHPAPPDMETLTNPAATDSNHHPIATVDLSLLAQRYSKIKIRDALEQRITKLDEVEDPDSLDEAEDTSGLENPRSGHVDKKRRLK